LLRRKNVGRSQYRQIVSIFFSLTSHLSLFKQSNFNSNNFNSYTLYCTFITNNHFHSLNFITNHFHFHSISLYITHFHSLSLTFPLNYQLHLHTITFTHYHSLKLILTPFSLTFDYIFTHFHSFSLQFLHSTHSLSVALSTTHTLHMHAVYLQFSHYTHHHTLIHSNLVDISICSSSIYILFNYALLRTLFHYAPLYIYIICTCTFTHH
jgi:hypothetical protein